MNEASTVAKFLRVELENAEGEKLSVEALNEFERRLQANVQHVIDDQTRRKMWRANKPALNAELRTVSVGENGPEELIENAALAAGISDIRFRLTEPLAVRFNPLSVKVVRGDGREETLTEAV